MNDVKTQSVGFLIFEGFPMACLTSMIEPLRAANEISGQEAFSWSLVAETMAKRRSSAGISFEPDLALSDLTRLDHLFLLSPPRAQFANAKAGFGALRARNPPGLPNKSEAGSDTMSRKADSSDFDGLKCTGSA